MLHRAVKLLEKNFKVTPYVEDLGIPDKKIIRM